MAASRGDKMAKEDLEIKQLEVETKACYAAEAKALAESLKGEASGHSKTIQNITLRKVLANSSLLLLTKTMYKE